MKAKAYFVGREPGSDVWLDDGSVSRVHAKVARLEDGRLLVTDLGSTNGTFVLDAGQWQPVREAVLSAADQVRFGECPMTAVELDTLCSQGAASEPAAADRRTDIKVPHGPNAREVGEPKMGGAPPRPARPADGRGGAWMRYAALAVVATGIVSMAWAVWMARDGETGTPEDGHRPRPAGTVPVSNQPGCGVFAPVAEVPEGLREVSGWGIGLNLLRGFEIESVSWTGDCVDGLAEGQGILVIWQRRGSDRIRDEARPVNRYLGGRLDAPVGRHGQFTRGKMDGEWCVRA